MIISEKNIFYYLYLVQMTGVALIWRAYASETVHFIECNLPNNTHATNKYYYRYDNTHMWKKSFYFGNM